MTTHATDETYPRVLIVNGEPFHQGSATGLTMARLFKGWPLDRLACIHMSNIPPDLSCCGRYWQLGLENLRFASWIARRRKRHNSTSDGANPAEASAGSQSCHEHSLPRRFLTTMRGHISGQALRDLDRILLPNTVQAEIDAFAPQVVYSSLGSNLLNNLVIRLALRYSIGIVPHFMDDWPSTHYRRSLARPFLRTRMRRELNRLLQLSAKRMVICPAMAAEYARRYGGEFVPFMNVVELERPEVHSEPPPERDKIQLLYVGGLHLGRVQCLREIAEALKYVQNQGMPVEALVYSQRRFAQYATQLDLPPVMRYAGSLQPHEIPPKLRAADILLHVESFRPSFREYTRFSVSTKIPECMASGRPILAYGPPELASIRYVEDTGAGLSVVRHCQGDLQRALRRLIESRDLRLKMGRQGRQAARRNHDATEQRERFCAVLRHASQLSI